MTSSEWTYEDLVIASAGSEWPDAPPKGLASYAFAVDRHAKEVLLTAAFDGSVSDDDRDEIWAIEGAVGAQLPDDWQANTQIILLHDGGSAPLPQSITIFERGTAVNPKALRAEVHARHGR
jgi:hypothetical protein